MRYFRHAVAIVAVVFHAGCTTGSAARTPAPASADAYVTPVAFMSGGDSIRATLFVAEGGEPHATVLFLSGFPGWPDAPPFLEPIHDAGYNVLFFPYRGTWASDGLFSAGNVLADAQAALAFLRSPDAQTTYRIDADEIVPYGTSFGGWVALSLAARDPSLECVAATVPANLGVIGRKWSTVEPYRTEWRTMLEQMSAELPVRLVDGPTGLMRDVMQHSDVYDIVPLMPALHDRTVILFGAEQDEVAPIATHYQPLADALRATNITALHLATAPGGHNDPQPAWDAEIVRWLGSDCLGRE